MPHIATLLGFALVSLGMVLTPGPNMIYLISRSITQGPAAGIVSLGGVALGFVFYMLCAAFGITALLFAVPYAYDALRFAGAAYLLWLAWQALKPNGRSPFQVKKLAGRQPAQIVRDGVRHQSFEPEDRDAVSGAAAAVHRSRRWQRADAVAGAGCDPDRHQRRRQCRMIALTAGSIALFLGTRPSWLLVQRWLMGTVLAGLAVKMAFEAKRA